LCVVTHAKKDAPFEHTSKLPHACGLCCISNQVTSRGHGEPAATSADGAPPNCA